MVLQHVVLFGKLKPTILARIVFDVQVGSLFVASSVPLLSEPLFAAFEAAVEWFFVRVGSEMIKKLQGILDNFVTSDAGPDFEFTLKEANGLSVLDTFEVEHCKLVALRSVQLTVQLVDHLVVGSALCLCELIFCC